MIRSLAAALLCLALANPADAQAVDSKAGPSFDGIAGADALKQRILQLAESYQGQGDTDGSRQRSLDKLVNELLELRPQPPVRDRLNSIFGIWKQVFGPYRYSWDGDRSVDPKIDPGHIYQAVFPDGFFINLSPQDARETGPVQDILLGRGKWQLAPSDPNLLKIRFLTLEETPLAAADLQEMWKLAIARNADNLPDRQAVIPGFMVRIFLGQGGLREVYTDSTLRIMYGARDLQDRGLEYIYVLRRVGDIP